MADQPTCKQRIQDNLVGRLDDLKKLWEHYCSGDEVECEDIGRFEDYGLCFDYVAPETFTDQHEGYYRYQLSWGGPSDEFRFYADMGPQGLSVYRVEYWFLDWFDGACRTLGGEYLELMEEIFNFFEEIGSCQAVYDKAMEY